jgi:hypothetical protein
MGDGLDKSPDEGDKSESAKAQAGQSAGTEGPTPSSEPVSEAVPPATEAKVEAEAEAQSKAEAKPKNDAIPDDLPVVESPKLDGSDIIEPVAEEAEFDGPDFDVGASIGPADVEAADSTIPQVAAEMPEPAVAPAPQQRSSRFPLLAAAIALAASLGALGGSLAGAGIVRLMPAAAAPSANTAEIRDLARTMREQLAEISTIKATLDNAARGTNAQFAKLGERLDKVEHAQADPAKLAHIADAVDRLGRGTAGSDITGSITTTAPTEPKITDRILEDWVVQQVQGGRALIENRNGGIFEVGAGSVLPGLGKVEAVKRQDGQWIVVTARGLILPGR